MNSFTFSGDTPECLQDFLDRHRWEDVQTFLADYCRVNKSTVRRWKNGKTPLGEELLRLRALLDLAGYHVKEFSELPAVIRQFGQAIAFGLIEPKSASEMLGYKNADGIYTTLLRGGSLLRDKLFRLERWVGNSQEDLSKASAELRDKLETIPKLNDELGSRRMLPPDTERVSDIEKSRQTHGGVLVPLAEAETREDDPFADRLTEALIQNLKATAELCAVAVSDPDRIVAALFAKVNEDDIAAVIGRINAVLSIRRSMG